ncbi:MAG: hypothetical protein ACLS3Y_07065 [Collinsella sp.]
MTASAAPPASKTQNTESIETSCRGPGNTRSSASAASFCRGDACRLIALQRLYAGGVSVAVGELADGL